MGFLVGFGLLNQSPSPARVLRKHALVRPDFSVIPTWNSTIINFIVIFLTLRTQMKIIINSFLRCNPFKKVRVHLILIFESKNDTMMTKQL